MPSEPISTIHGVGPDLVKKFGRLNIRTKLDLLLHLPFRYLDQTRITPFSEVEDGVHCVIQGMITEVRVTQKQVNVHVRDDANLRVLMRLFHFHHSRIQKLQKGSYIRLCGVTRLGSMGWEMAHPRYWVVYPNQPQSFEPQYIPVYRAVKGLSSTRIQRFMLKSLSEIAFLPKFDWNDLKLGDALKFVHQPVVEAGLQHVNTARRRIAFDELLAFFLLKERRRVQRTTDSIKPFKQRTQLAEKFVDCLGFSLTNAQQKVIAEIDKDLGMNRPMLRLLQGDVGSGKTVVAAHAMIKAAENDFQTAFMAPTEILAEQHYETLSHWLDPLGVSVGLLTGQLSTRARRAREAAISDGEDMVVVGTHALFQKSVHFRSLGLAIIDEQHRFGVHQRMMLRDKGNVPHQLIMTATPIPRTLALYLFADMDLSVIDELPPGRQPIQTTIHSPAQRNKVIAALRRHVENAQQAYWVCAAIAEQDEDESLIGTDEVEKELQRTAPELRVQVLHGQMDSETKRSTMEGFRNGNVDVLIATTVIEVGVDVPNASLMIIDNAEHMGLAQLHQLRGRVGRGTTKSFCMLNYQGKLSPNQRERLQALRHVRDGFELAELDLKLRGAGEVFGTKQSGAENFRVADLARDLHLLVEVEKFSKELAQTDADLASKVIETWSPAESDYAAA